MANISYLFAGRLLRQGLLGAGGCLLALLHGKNPSISCEGLAACRQPSRGWVTAASTLCPAQLCWQSNQNLNKQN